MLANDVKNFIGVQKRDLARSIRKLVPDYMPMGAAGMADMGEMEMPMPDNTLPMMTGFGQFGPIEMGGMFTLMKIREGLGPNDYKDPGAFTSTPQARSHMRSTLHQRRCPVRPAQQHQRRPLPKRLNLPTRSTKDTERGTEIMYKLSTAAAAAGLLLTAMMALIPAYAHEDALFFAGEPGDPKKPARTIRVLMIDDGSETDMNFEPAVITVRKGEQIRFVLENAGTEGHEFMLATVAENRKHAELMKKFPDMEHDDPNGKRLASTERGELLWRFTKAGEFEFACLIPGHYEAGMHGKIIVK